MRIIFFTENYYCGGIDTFIINLINHWPDDDEFRLICNENHPGLKVIEACLTRPCTIVKHSILTYAGLASKTKKIVFLNMVRKLFSPILQYLFLIYNVFALRKLLLHNNPDRLMIINGGYPGGDSCRAASISWGIFTGKSYSIHNFHNMVIAPPWYIKLQEYLVDTLVSRYTRLFVSVSQACAGSMPLRPVINKNKIMFIYNGIDAGQDNPISISGDLRSELDIPANSLLCIMLGTYEPRKGHYFLLKAFKQVVDKIPSAHLIICGHGFPEEIEAVRKAVEQLDMTRYVHMFGFRDDVSYLIQNADVLLVSSQVFESFGLTCVEAMAHRVPVVATQVGGLPEVVRDGEGGYCLPPDDVEGYASQIIRLLENEELRREQGEKGYQRYQRMFTGERMAKEYEQVIHGEN